MNNAIGRDRANLNVNGGLDDLKRSPASRHGNGENGFSAEKSKKIHRGPISFAHSRAILATIGYGS
ncbi:MAG: hypothetical protein PF501_05940 [Salinisphaera sp.]|nr:hypothetical protein [Salinisphaera sp.]